jgi:LmbE family N-acetylglucosaminyl deacetylase
MESRKMPRMRHLLAAVVTLAGLLTIGRAQSPDEAQGASAVWEQLRKLQTTATAMHTTAHPDDEHGGVLAMLSRGRGVHVSMLTLTRGESGDNAIGPELFDALGLIRTEELAVANRHYGVDRQYFTTVVDYGFSKRLDEALDKWGTEYVLRDVVRVVRAERPMVLISRFQGNPRDGHGNHEAAGLITREAFKAAGDPKRFPELIAEGLSPWQPLKLYMGGVRQNEEWTLRVDAGEFDPVIGESYQTLARRGLSYQRSQTGGRFVPQIGPAVSYYTRLSALVDAPGKESGFFDGIDVTIRGIYKALKRTAPAEADSLLRALEAEIAAAIGAFRFDAPAAAAPALARALAAARAARSRLRADRDVEAMLALKEEQITKAINGALAVSLTAVAQPEGTPEGGGGPLAGGPIAMPPVVPGQSFEVRATFVHRGPAEMKGVAVRLEPGRPGAGWKPGPAGPPSVLSPNQPAIRTFEVTLAPDVPPTRPGFSRASIQEARYTVHDESARFRPAAGPALVAVAGYQLDGVDVEIRRPVVRFEPNLPYGFDTYELAVVPALAVSLNPAHRVIPTGNRSKTVSLTADVQHNRHGPSEGSLTLRVPAGWTLTPAAYPLKFARAGERSRFVFDVAIPVLEPREYRIEAVATSGGREYREGYTTLRHRDLEVRYLYRGAVTAVRGLDVDIAPGLKVGYVMGIGDQVPESLAQLGVDVELLDEQDLASANLAPFHAIITGTRAYAVRDDLKTYNRRLLDYVEAGGNLIVLYNTQELEPNLYAPYPGELPRTAEEVSEEDSPVRILAPDAAVLRTPNLITAEDFNGWVEQRGSKFWTTWDARYTPLIETWDRGQAPQRGGWLQARYGKGHYTYFAYAFHRQLPYGVPGAYRLLANLLSLGRM